MDLHRHRVLLVTLVGLSLLPAACAPTKELGSVRAYSYPRQQTDPFWWRTLVDVQGARDQGLTGNGRMVAIVDTGVLKTHEDLTSSNIVDGLEYCSAAPTTNTTDENGHGTQLAGIVLGNDPTNPSTIRTTRGVAPSAKLVPFKVVCAVTKALAVIQAVQRAAATTPPPDVILLALGPWPGDTDSNGNDVHTLIAPFVSVNPNILFVVASVWDPTYTAVPRPAWTNYKNVIVVAGMTLDDKNKEVPFNEKGGDIWAPAQGVGTASITQDPKDASKHLQFLMPGTSAASAIVAGCAALIKEKNSGNPMYDGKALRDALVAAVESQPDLPGAGRLKCSMAVR